ncbi:MAG: ATP-binding protein, partial [Streptosporangiaceae bacterium]
RRDLTTGLGLTAEASALRPALASHLHAVTTELGNREHSRERGRNVNGAAAKAATCYQRTFHGQADQVSQVRREVASYLAGCPAADDAVLTASELAANSVVHSASGGEFFTVRCQAYPDYVWVEVEDLGGPWRARQPDGRPHGLDLINALAGPDNWGTETTSDGDRIVWARLGIPRDGNQR